MQEIKWTTIETNVEVRREITTKENNMEMIDFVTVSTIDGKEYFRREWQGEDVSHIAEQFCDAQLGEKLIAVFPIEMKIEAMHFPK